MMVDDATGLEWLAREVLIILANELNDEIAAQQAKWATADQDLFATLERAYSETTLEPIALSRFYLGHIPSLIDAPIDYFPNIAVTAFESGPDETLGADLYHGIVNIVAIELMCKSGPYADKDLDARYLGEELVNRRTHRTVDAVVAVLNKNPNLNGLALGLQAPPTVEIFDVFKRHESRDRGPLWLWQGARLEFQIQRAMQGVL